jgi:hypothetical protein
VEGWDPVIKKRRVEIPLTGLTPNFLIDKSEEEMMYMVVKLYIATYHH